MGNSDGKVVENFIEGNNSSPPDRFVIKFIRADDIPAIETNKTSKCNPYIRAYIQNYVPQLDASNRKSYKLQKISCTHNSPKRLDCDSVTWNCYRDFQINPPLNSLLTVELYSAEGNSESDHIKLGYLNLDITEELNDELPKKFHFLHNYSNTLKNPDFSIELCRVFIHTPPPRLKTFFLIRHGESKWNEAQNNIDIGGMLLDRDHALTENGCKQAMELNNKWKLHLLDDTIPAAPTTSVPSERTSRSSSLSGDGIPFTKSDGNIFEFEDEKSLGHRSTRYFDRANTEDLLGLDEFINGTTTIDSISESKSSEAIPEGHKAVSDTPHQPVDILNQGTCDPLADDRIQRILPNPPIDPDELITERQNVLEEGYDIQDIVLEGDDKDDGILFEDENEINIHKERFKSRRIGSSELQEVTKAFQAKQELKNLLEMFYRDNLTMITKGLLDIDQLNEVNNPAVVSNEVVSTSPDASNPPSGPSKVTFATMTMEPDLITFDSDPVDPLDQGVPPPPVTHPGIVIASSSPPSNMFSSPLRATERIFSIGPSGPTNNPSHHGSRRFSTEGSIGMKSPKRRNMLKQQRDIYIKLFLLADKVYCSPLTRAIETALLSLQHHPAFHINFEHVETESSHDAGIILYSIIREIKRIGGLDTVGIEYGPKIVLRVLNELQTTIGRYRDVEDLMATHPIIINDADQPWWSALSSYESEKEQQDRVKEFLSFVRYNDDAIVPIFVGHSLFFKAFYSRRVSDVLQRNRPELSDNLRKHRLGNATLLAVTVLYTDVMIPTVPNKLGIGVPSTTSASFISPNSNHGATSYGFECTLLDADLLFGGGFHGTDESSKHNKPPKHTVDSNHDQYIAPPNLSHDPIRITSIHPQRTDGSSSSSSNNKMNQDEEVDDQSEAHLNGPNQLFNIAVTTIQSTIQNNNITQNIQRDLKLGKEAIANKMRLFKHSLSKNFEK